MCVSFRGGLKKSKIILDDRNKEIAPTIFFSTFVDKLLLEEFSIISVIYTRKNHECPDLGGKFLIPEVSVSKLCVYQYIFKRKLIEHEKIVYIIGNVYNCV